MSKLHCRTCGELTAETRGSNLIVFTHSNNHADEIDVEKLFEEYLLTTKGAEFLQRMNEKWNLHCLNK